MNSTTEIKRMWSIFQIGPEDPISLRALWPKGVPGTALPTINRTFSAAKFPNVADRQAAFEAEALSLNAQGYNCYVVMNPIDPAFLMGAVSDEDIACRRYLLIDVDRSETKEPASEEEIEETLEVANRIEAFLITEYGADEAMVCSGNGFHLYLPLADLPNDESSKRLCKDLLHALARRFNTPTVKIDTAVYNAARITKVLGTVARKGSETEDRPYRRAHLIT